MQLVSPMESRRVLHFKDGRYKYTLYILYILCIIILNIFYGDVNGPIKKEGSDNA